MKDRLQCLFRVLVGRGGQVQRGWNAVSMWVLISLFALCRLSIDGKPISTCERVPGASPGTRWRSCHLSGTLLSQRLSQIYLTSVVARADEITVNEGTSPQEARHSKYCAEWSTKQISSWLSIFPRAGGTTIGSTPQSSVPDYESANPNRYRSRSTNAYLDDFIRSRHLSLAQAFLLRIL